MKEITPLLFVKACASIIFLSISSAYAQDIISDTLPTMRAAHPAPTEVQSTDGGFFNNFDLEILQRINQERVNGGLDPLRLFHYEGANETAAWTKYRADNGIRAAHPQNRGVDAGLPGGVYAAEIANGATSPTPADLVRGYMLSERHRAIIMTPKANVAVSASYVGLDPRNNGLPMTFNTVRIIDHPDSSSYGMPPAPFTIAGEKCTVLGTNGNDTIITDKPEHIVMAFAGNDTVTGASVVAGGRGHDTITGTYGDDRLYGQWGWDKIYGYAGDDRLYGGPGSDTIHGHKGNDRILGGYGDDKLYGQDGDDEIFGQKGNDRLYGQGGDDILYPGPSGDTNVAVQ